MLPDFDSYLIGCRDREIIPLSRWRFTITYGIYQRMLHWAMEDWRRLERKRQRRIVLRWNRARDLHTLVCRGRKLAARVSPGSDDSSGAAGAGDRVPRVPLTPVLLGGAARPLPPAQPLSRTELWA